MLSTIATINNTETKLTQKVNLLTSKLNRVLSEVNQAQGWFSTIDANKVNIHILAAYQLAAELIQDVEHHYLKFVECMLGKGSLFDFISPRQLMNIIKEASSKIPPNLQIAHEPEKRVNVFTNGTTLTVSGYLYIIGFQIYSLDKLTPIPRRIHNNSYVALDAPTSILATNYDTQTYFDLTEAELQRCEQQDELFLCSPSVVSNIDSNPNCLIDEIYHRPERKHCPLKVFTTPDIIWKRLYMKNTWLFIANHPSTAAIKCNGIREDAILNGTGILQVGQECLIQTKKNTLIAEVTNTLPVKLTFSKPVDFNISMVSPTNKTKLSHLELEPILKTSDDFADIVTGEKILEKIPPLLSLKTVGHHTATGISSITITISIILIYKFIKAWRTRRRVTIEVSSSTEKNTAPRSLQRTHPDVEDQYSTIPPRFTLPSNAGEAECSYHEQ